MSFIFFFLSFPPTFWGGWFLICVVDFAVIAVYGEVM